MSTERRLLLDDTAVTLKTYVPSLDVMIFPVLALYPLPVFLMTGGNTYMSPTHELLYDVTPTVDPTSVSSTENKYIYLDKKKTT